MIDISLHKIFVLLTVLPFITLSVISLWKKDRALYYIGTLIAKFHEKLAIYSIFAFSFIGLAEMNLIVRISQKLYNFLVLLPDLSIFQY